VHLCVCRDSYGIFCVCRDTTILQKGWPINSTHDILSTFVLSLRTRNTTIQYCKSGGGQSESALVTSGQVQKVEHKYLCHLCVCREHSLVRGLEERDPEDIFSRQINFQCFVFCVTLLPFVIFVVFCVIVFSMIPP
jgi:hypothetical protein